MHTDLDPILGRRFLLMGIVRRSPVFLAALASVAIASPPPMDGQVLEVSNCAAMPGLEVRGMSLLQDHRQASMLIKTSPQVEIVELARDPLISLSLLQSVSEGSGTLSFPKHDEQLQHSSMLNMAHNASAGSSYKSSLWYYVPVSVSLIVGLFVLALVYCLMAWSLREHLENESLAEILGGGSSQTQKPQVGDKRPTAQPLSVTAAARSLQTWSSFPPAEGPATARASSEPKPEIATDLATQATPATGASIVVASIIAPSSQSSPHIPQLIEEVSSEVSEVESVRTEGAGMTTSSQV